MKPKHVVLIEDNPDILEILEVLIREAGYRVTAMESVVSLEDLLTMEADVFVLDEQLPMVSGHIICIYLRSKPVTAKVPVMLISAHPRLGNYAELCSADTWIPKPFDALFFLDELKKLLV